MRRNIKRMSLKPPYVAVVATGEGVEMKASHKGLSLSYCNTWDGIKADCSELADRVRGSKEILTVEEDPEPLRLVSSKE
jgi:hypothetical protein